MSLELEKFKADGFVVAKGLLDKQGIQCVVHSIARTFWDARHGQPGIGGEDTFAAMQALYQHDTGKYKKVAAALWRKLDVFQLMHDPRIIAFLHDKFGWGDIFVPGGQVVHIMAHELKIPDGYFGLVTHQDFPSVQGSLDGVVVWLPLVDVDKDNFPLEVIPGSHKRGLLPMRGEGNAVREVAPDQYREEDFIPAEVEVGDVIFMSMFTIHRTSTHGTPGRLRLAASTRFDNAAEQTYVARCYPTAYERMVHREQYVADFPVPEQIAAIFRPVGKA